MARRGVLLFGPTASSPMSALSSMGKSWRWVLGQKPALAGSPAQARALWNSHSQNPPNSDGKQEAFRKGVTYHKDPRFAGAPHLEQLVGELSFIGGGDARNQSHRGLPDGAGGGMGSGAVCLMRSPGQLGHLGESGS